MKYLTLIVLAVVTACNSVTVVPIDDEDAGDDAGTESGASGDDAAADASADR